MPGTSSIAPISLASIAIGFISFAFTLAIWLNAFWEAFGTLINAPYEVRDSLSPLRQGLYEEREYLKRLRKRQDSHSVKGKQLYYEGGPTKVINEAVKDLITAFKHYEEPFLVAPHDGREKDLEWSFNATQQQYQCDLWHRILWLRFKGGVERIAVLLQRMQTRRIAVEVTESRFMLANTQGMVRDCEDRIRDLEERLQRVGRGGRDDQSPPRWT